MGRLVALRLISLNQSNSYILIESKKSTFFNTKVSPRRIPEDRETSIRTTSVKKEGHTTDRIY